jgi:hypothetical protein
MTHHHLPANQQPAPRWKRFLFAPLLGVLTYYANRRFRGRENWYRIKDLVLAQYGRPDGCDLQVLPPAECWSCKKGVPRNTVLRSLRPDGSCAQCDGHGNYAPEKYVQLYRRKLWRFVFHTPGSVTRHVPSQGYDRHYWARFWDARNIIEGLITDPQTRWSKWLGNRSRVVLQLLFDFKHFWPHFLRRVFWRPIFWWEGQQKLWSYGCHWLQRPRFSPWHTSPNWNAYHFDDDLPF